MGDSLRCDIDMRSGKVQFMWFPRPPKLRRPRQLADIGNARGLAADAVDRYRGWKNVIVELNQQPQFMIPALGGYPHELKQKHLDDVSNMKAIAVRFGVITRYLNEGTPEEREEQCAVWVDAETGETLALAPFKDFSMGPNDGKRKPLRRFRWSTEDNWTLGDISGSIRPTILGSQPSGKLVRLARGAEHVTAIFDAAQGLVGVEVYGKWVLGKPDAALLNALQAAPAIEPNRSFGS